jgi:hypothetical protein
VFDHVLGARLERFDKRDRRPPNTDESPFHEVFVLFEYLGACTRRLELVTSIVILPQRQTALVAKQAAAVNVLTAAACGSAWASVAVHRAHRPLLRTRRPFGSVTSGTTRLDDYSWHGNRHPFASRLVMAGVDVRTPRCEVGIPLNHLQAVERLVPSSATAEDDSVSCASAVELERNFDGADGGGVGVS